MESRISFPDELIESVQGLISGGLGWLVLGGLVAMAIWAIDDLLFVLSRFTRGTRVAKDRVLDESAIAVARERRIAVLIPAWSNDALLTHTIANLCEHVDYSNVVHYIGTWDGHDQSGAANFLSSRYANVHCVPMAFPGSAARAINALASYASTNGEDAGKVFDGFLVLNPGESLHPSGLKLLSAVLASSRLVRLPVFPANDEAGYFSSRQLRDDACVHHLYEMPGRDHLGACVTGAGLALGFSRELVDTDLSAIERLTGVSRSPLDDKSLVPDVALTYATRDPAFPADSRPWARVVLSRRRSTPTRGSGASIYPHAIAVRRRLQHQFTNAQRYRSRRIAGLFVEALRQIRRFKGGSGSVGFCYGLWRDIRQMPLAHMTVLALVSAAVLEAWSRSTGAGALQWVGHIAGGNTLVPWAIAAAALGVLHWLTRRVISVAVVYGAGAGAITALLSVPAAAFEYLAVWRASVALIRDTSGARTRRYVDDVPVLTTAVDANTDSPRAQQLGQLLINRGHLNERDLDHALAVQRDKRRPLGRILIDAGITREADLLEALSDQLAMPIAHIVPRELTARVGMLLPRRTLLRERVFPVYLTHANTLHVACYRLLDRSTVETIRREAGMPVRFFLASRASVRQALRLYGILIENVEPRLLANSRESLGTLVDRVRHGSKRRRPADNRRLGLGEYLVAEGFLDRHVMKRCVERAAARRQSLGDYLVNQGFVTESQLDKAIERNRRIRGIRLATVKGKHVDDSLAASRHRPGNGSGGVGNVH